MLNTKKFLYVLPDVAYMAELLPTKKEHNFSIQAFRQINGEFIVDEELVPESIEKLFSKLEKDEYQIVLPDFLFTNTILEVKETTESKIKQQLEDKILPSLTLTKDTHQIETFTLNQFQSLSKVQLSALENTVLAPISQSTKNHEIIITGISPLSWTLKALISLEPSISVVQMGSNLYLAFHYIGVDQTTSWSVNEIENIAETIRTLKGTEPSIQTLYLLTNDLVEDKLKELLSDKLPLQQLTPGGEETTDLPSYVKAVIETGSKTLDISDFPVPVFSLPKNSTSAAVPAVKPALDEESEEVENLETMKLPKPSAPDALPSPELAEALPEPEKVIDLPAPSEPEEAVEVIEAVKETPAEEKEDELLAQFASAESQPKPELEPEQKVESKTEVAMSTDTDNVTSVETPANRPNLDLSETSSGRQVIKNPAGNSHMLKMIGIFVAVMVVTIGLGVGVGLGLLSLSNKGEQLSPTTTPSPTVAVASPSPTAAPSASPAAELDRSKYSVLVVNATTIAGKAGDIKADLEKAGFKNVKSGNAKGKYDGGVVVLMKEEDKALVTLLEKDLDLTLKFDSDIKTEDSAGTYDIVIVFANQS